MMTFSVELFPNYAPDPLCLEKLGGHDPPQLLWERRPCMHLCFGFTSVIAITAGLCSKDLMSNFNSYNLFVKESALEHRLGLIFVQDIGLSNLYLFY